MPEVAVVIPSRRGTRLEAALAALADQTIDRDRFEVIVVRDPLSEFGARAPDGLRVRFLDLGRECGPAVKRNAGWRAAHAPLVAFTDDDCVPTPGWLSALIEAGRREPAALLQGQTAPSPDEVDALSPYSRTQTVAGLGPWYPTCNLAVPLRVLEVLNGFDERYATVGGEDTDLAWRALERGVPARYAEDAVVHHAVERLGALAKLRVAARWGRAAGIFRRHPALRAELTLGLFWKHSHALLLLACLGALLARRFPPAALLALPYMRQVRARIAVERGRPVDAPFYAVHDAVEIASVGLGSARAGRLVL